MEAEAGLRQHQGLILGGVYTRTEYKSMSPCGSSKAASASGLTTRVSVLSLLSKFTSSQSAMVQVLDTPLYFVNKLVRKRVTCHPQEGDRRLDGG